MANTQILILLVFFFAARNSLGCDDLSTSCKNYESRKNYYCNHEWTRINCPKMCRICTGGGSLTTLRPPVTKKGNDNCKDLSNDCLYYRSIGFCEQSHYNHIWASVNCKKSCFLCGPALNTTLSPPNLTTQPIKTTKPKPVTNIPQDNCGIPSLNTRVVSGSTSKIGQWPWQIALYRDGKFSCGGSLISPDWIVTAAHCLYRFHPSQFYVVAGESDIYNQNQQEQKLQVEHIIWHQNYGRPSTLNNDIGLIKLAKPVIMGTYVKTICLPNVGETPKVGSKCFVSGWGKMTHPGSSAQFLQHASLDILHQDVCKQRNDRWAPITNKMICAANGWPNIQASCHGDSGGPLVCKQPKGNWVLHGAVSWGSPRCYIADAYSVFAKVSEFRPWIDGSIKNYTV